jgi:Transposase C of IS166 homeodomain/zinc-finger binding domain of transposase IS66
LTSRDEEIERLKLLIAKLRRMQFGRKSEKLDWEIEQLELKLDELEASRAQQAAASPSPKPVSDVNRTTTRERQPLPAHLPRETHKILPKQETCPDCSGALKPLGEDVSETLEYVPEHIKMIRYVRSWLVRGTPRHTIVADGEATKASMGSCETMPERITAADVHSPAGRAYRRSVPSLARPSR